MFYTKRTAQEQASRLPSSVRNKYMATQLDRIEIDGVEIQGYFEYSFMEEKSYVTQPVRSGDGVIEEIDDYTTFLIPRLIIKYNMMAIEDYRTLMKMLKTKNAFMVTCYDIVEDERVTHEMYFAPPSMPIIYQQYLMALGIQEYNIELIGTGRTGSSYITYYFNFPSDAIVGENVTSNNQTEKIENKNEKYVVGDFKVVTDNPASSGMEYLKYWVGNYTLIGWNTKADGSGVHFDDMSPYYFPLNTTLYAQWSRD